MGTLRAQKDDFLCIIKIENEKGKNFKHGVWKEGEIKIELREAYIGAKKRNKPEAFPAAEKEK